MLLLTEKVVRKQSIIYNLFSYECPSPLDNSIDSVSFASENGNMYAIHSNQIKPLSKQGRPEITIDQEEIAQALEYEKRLKVFTDILENTRSGEFSGKTLIYGIVKVLVPALFICPFALIPAHNVFEEPEYWYEYPLMILIVFMPQTVTYIIMNCSFWMNIRYIQNTVSFNEFELIQT